MKSLLRSPSFLALFLVFANLLDCIFTYIGLNHAGGKELNPLMDYLIQHSWTTFFVVKMSLVIILSYILWFFSRLKILLILSCFYSLLVLYYIYSFFVIFAL